MTVTIILHVEPISMAPVQAVTEIIAEAFGKEERKDVPRAKLILMQLEKVR